MKQIKLLAVVGLMLGSFSFANASENLNVKKVNRVMNGIVKEELKNAQVLTSLKFELSKDTVLDGDSPKAGLACSAKAKSAAWTQKPSTVDFGVRMTTVKMDIENNDATADVAIGLKSKTDSLALYRFASGKLLKETFEDGQTPQPGFEANLAALLTDATTASTLNHVADQLERLRVLLVNEVENPDPNNKHDWWLLTAQVIKSLKVNVTEKSGKVTNVELTSTEAVELGEAFRLNKLALNVSENEIGVLVDFRLIADVAHYQGFVEEMKEFFLLVQNASKEELEQIRSVVQDAIEMAEDFLTDKQGE